MHNLILLRHGRSEWNEKNLFTGWYDCPLAATGASEAGGAVPLLAAAGLLPDVVHTSLLQRAIATAEIVLAGLGRSWIPVRRSWRLNERHYGNLTGLDKAATRRLHGAEQLQAWRRSYDTRPPEIDADNPYNPNTSQAYSGLPPEILPRTECLRDVLERLLPYWYDAVVPDLRLGRTVLIAAHGNSLRALVKHLDGMADDEIVRLDIPTGMPLHYLLDSAMAPADTRHPLERALDPAAAAVAAAEVAAEAE